MVSEPTCTSSKPILFFNVELNDFEIATMVKKFDKYVERVFVCVWEHGGKVSWLDLRKVSNMVAAKGLLMTSMSYLVGRPVTSII